MADKAPDVFVKSNQPFDSGKRVLSVRERQSLENELATRSGILGATEGSYGMATGGGTPVLPPGMAINKARISQRAKEIAKVLEDGRPEPLSPDERDRVARRVKELEAKFDKENVLETVAELRVMRRDSHDWQTAMDKAKRRPQYEREIAEWQNLKRRLEPEDDEADNLNRLRKSK